MSVAWFLMPVGPLSNASSKGCAILGLRVEPYARDIADPLDLSHNITLPRLRNLSRICDDGRFQSPFDESKWCEKWDVHRLLIPGTARGPGEDCVG